MILYPMSYQKLQYHTIITSYIYILFRSAEDAEIEPSGATN